MDPIIFLPLLGSIIGAIIGARLHKKLNNKKRKSTEMKKMAATHRVLSLSRHRSST